MPSHRPEVYVCRQPGRLGDRLLMATERPRIGPLMPGTWGAWRERRSFFPCQSRVAII